MAIELTFTIMVSLVAALIIGTLTYIQNAVSKGQTFDILKYLQIFGVATAWAIGSYLATGFVPLPADIAAYLAAVAAAGGAIAVTLPAAKTVSAVIKPTPAATNVNPSGCTVQAMLLMRPAGSTINPRPDLEGASPLEVEVHVYASPTYGPEAACDFTLDFGDGSATVSGALQGGQAVVNHIYRFQQTDPHYLSSTYYPSVVVKSIPGGSYVLPKHAATVVVNQAG